MAPVTYLVLGGHGWLGSALLPLLGGDVHAPRSAQLDVADTDAVAAVVAQLRPDVVLNLAACGPGQGDAARMHAVNGVGVRAVARAAAGTRLVHVSSDVVLDGRHAPYADGAERAPVNEYGRSKAAGEVAVEEEHAAAVIVRTSLVFDPTCIDRSTAGFVQRLERAEPCRLFTDEFRCPISRHTLAAAIAELALHDFTGHLNVAGTTSLSRHEFGMTLLRHFGCADLDRVEATLAADLGVPRPPDLTLDVSRAQSLLRTPLRSVAAELSDPRSSPAS